VLAIFDDVVDNAPISIEKEYVDTNGDRDPQRILVKHNHVAVQTRRSGSVGGCGQRLSERHRSTHVIPITIVTQIKKQ